MKSPRHSCGDKDWERAGDTAWEYPSRRIKPAGKSLGENGDRQIERPINSLGHSPRPLRIPPASSPLLQGSSGRPAELQAHDTLTPTTEESTPRNTRGVIPREPGALPWRGTQRI